MSNSTSSSLPVPRRVITGHDSLGKSIVIRDEQVEPIAPGNIARHDIHATNETPAKVDSELDNNGKWKDETETMTSVFNLESSFSIMDFHPRAQAGLHRSITMDYAIVMKGSINLILDDGLEVTLSEGDSVVQRATMHGWKNASSTETCRIAFIILPARAPVVEGTALKEDIPWMKKKDAQL